ncbi:hypothetical protein DWB84_16020 [Saccharophagus sp. K07]|uniref:DUF6748 domain-containing protein n=1 Tax=Saccharophagus sp. K07 TaxID=2283636 RepID=UPI001652822F|nr:DUF6748 domain-containing protein [Saccharophagus sp. K07]MBC6906955.1 hypothetical protein [Saccharophagus sp. K07]
MKIGLSMKWVAVFLLLFTPFGLTHALIVAPDQQSFEITQGKVSIKPVFCIPERCQERSGELTGTFDATFLGDEIRLSNINVKSELEEFKLPEDPHTDVNGAVYDARYKFDGEILVLEGVIDSSAFDGPLVRYSLTAKVRNSLAVGFDPHGFYLAHQDYRRCAAPHCGGIFIKAVNDARLICHDGRASKECYIGTPDWRKLGFNPFAVTNSEQLLLQGDVDYTVELGRFVARAALAPAGNDNRKGSYFGVENNGLMCISSPCFSFDEYLLNSDKAQAISDVDLSRTGASEKDIQRAFELMAEKEAVIIVGRNQRYKGFSGTGVRLLATQFYLPVDANAAENCPKGYISSELGCETPRGCPFPLQEKVTTGARLIAPAPECVVKPR